MSSSKQSLLSLSEFLRGKEIKINSSAIKEAAKILKNLPDEIPIPELIDEANGFLTLEWYKDPKNIFVISLNGTKTLEFAWMYGGSKEFSGKLDILDMIPESLIEDLKVFLQYDI
jgi:hypothetical protein